MRAFLVFLVITVVAARPEAPYNYPRPAPPPQPLPPPQLPPLQPISAPGPSFASQSSAVSFQQYQPQQLPSPNYGTPVAQQPLQPLPSQNYPSQPISSYGTPAFGLTGSGSSSSSSFASSNFAPQPPQPPQPPIVQKHIYVHVPPPEPVEEQARFQAAAAPRTNYKIIFIKAPSAPAVSQQVIQQQAQNQEKTIVYVLVKKPDEQEALTFAGLPPSKPSKPEVYFIKYKAKSEVVPQLVTDTSSASNVVSSGYGAPPLQPQASQQVHQGYP